MRRTLVLVLAVLVAVLALGTAVVATSGGSTVTRPRLERSLPVVFSHVYAQQAALQGRTGITPASLHATAMCDKHGANVADQGPGGDWVCLMSWDDPDVQMPPEGYGKFELNVHSNDCFTATAPTKLTGFLTMTDQQGREVMNPVFEFDGCFDPQSDSSDTGIFFPSLLAITSTTLTPDRDGNGGIQMTCGTGSEGCAGTMAITTEDGELGTTSYQLREASTMTVALPQPVPDGATTVTFTVTPDKGVGPTSPVTLPVQGR